MQIFCVIPAYNEAKNIKAVVSEVKPLVEQVVVVDDGSNDQTAELAENAGASVAVLRHIINRGQGAALRAGTEYSLAKGADIIVHFDADGQFLSQDIAKVVAPLKSGQAEVVFGSRFLMSRGTKFSAPADDMPWFKKYLIMPLARAVNKIFFQVNLTDPQSGFRAMTASAARQIDWQQDRMAHCSEIMLAVKKSKLAVTEVPIRVIYHHFGQSFADGLKILKDLFMAMLVS